jgi:hypothetical protein
MVGMVRNRFFLSPFLGCSRQMWSGAIICMEHESCYYGVNTKFTSSYVQLGRKLLWAGWMDGRMDGLK